ncbi:alpha-L-rhamnosidase [Treponema sp. J25]|uniref:alpha-L-rhamnosidase n=1 Tax=Treponema sp. J25 TaxID=2094121 RepID=UPI00104B16F0|nr:alpha-L-rhamnosidase [Treponema sp. J25]TCW61448.1 alpha-L-rhamnosidase [Treponema sp. J25]
MITVIQTTCNYEPTPLGIDTPQPVFGWALATEEPGIMQTHYRIQVSRDVRFNMLLWDSRWVKSSRSQGISYDGPSLRGRQRYYYRIAVRTNRKEESPWSETSWFETAFINEPWPALFIAIDENQQETFSRPQYLRRVFTLDSVPKNARLYVTALGLYEVYLNGKRVGDAYFTPGWTSYEKRLQYQTYEVGPLLRAGTNVVALILANGWYRGYLTWFNESALYGENLAASLCLFGSPGDSTPLVTTDAQWEWTWGPLEYAELYHGERYDARQEIPQWFTDAAYQGSKGACRVTQTPLCKLVAQAGPLVKKQETLKPIAFFVTPRGERVLDFGQNLTGWVRFTVTGASGSRVVLCHAEVLDKDGNFYTENLRKAKNTIEYVCRGEGEETFEARFSFQGFRYVQVVEWPGEISPESFTAQVLHSDMRETLEFFCSNPMLNQLHHNIQWGWKGNSLDVPTDCPQRDERLGWTGDAQVFVGTASYLRDVRSFFRKWLADLALDQLPNGGMPFVIPDVLSRAKSQDPNFKGAHSSTGWGDAAVICPWTLYERYGDRELLKKQYPSMKQWVEYIRSVARGGLLWRDGFHFGDWVALDAKEGSYFGATPNDLVATAFYAYSVYLLALAAQVLGYKTDARRYQALHEAIVRAFQKEFITPNGRLVSPTQTAHILVLVFNLAPEKHRKRILEDLVAILGQSNNHLTTGFLGTPFILKALSEHGRTDLAYKLLLQQDYPSWLYQITKGATTIWEHWDGIKPDGSFWSPEMNSFNHYAYGAVGQWMYETLGGLRFTHDEEGHPLCLIAPQPGGGITQSMVQYHSVYGSITVSWRCKGNILNLEVTLPPNVQGLLRWPGKKIRSVNPWPLHKSGWLKLREPQKSDSVLELQMSSGRYTLVGEI